MKYTLRYIITDLSNPLGYKTAGDDMLLSELPTSKYGLPVTFEGVEYVVASLQHLKRIPDPLNPTKQALLIRSGFS